VELKETTENLSQMLSQGKKRTLEEHEEGLQEENEQMPDQQDDAENGDAQDEEEDEGVDQQNQATTNINENE